MKSYRFILLLFFVIQSFFGANLQAQIKDSLLLNTNKIYNNESVALQNSWEFYWKEFIEPGNFNKHKPLDTVSLTSWNNYLDKDGNNLPSFGYATYRLNFSLDKDSLNVSLYIPKINGAYKIWVNDEFILNTGKVGKNKGETIHRRFAKVIQLNSKVKNFEIVIHVSNFFKDEGGITEPISIELSDNLYYKQTLRIMIDMISIGSFFFVGILFLYFFLVYWDKDKAVLYFSILCLAKAYHTLNSSYAPLTRIFDDISWAFLVKTEYIASYITGLAASLFFSLILKDFIFQWYRKVVIIVTSTLIILAITLPAPYFTRLIIVFLVFMLLNIIYIFFVVIKSIIAKTEISKILLVCITFTSATFMAHIIFFLYDNEVGLIYIKIGYFIIFLLLSMIMLRRFSNSFHQLELANNLAVQQKKEITKINSQLKDNLKQLEENNAELDDFNHIVSHDLKSPLVSVYSLATFIEDDLKENINEETKSYFNLLKDVITKMEASINGLLEYSKSTKSNKKKETFLLNDLLIKISNFIDNQQKCTFIFPDKDFKVYANKVELEHVFQNLISNSIKYNDKEKTIITISALKQEKQYLFSVKDNGPGIEEKYHGKIFKIFNQLEINSKDIDSTGVGLAIVKKIISKNNGNITVSSEKSKGLTISFSWDIEDNL